ncbi:DUF4176 domain-containing protein [Streptococcus ferus]|uniref:DUF4176 domain-containing protein n=1 Tax=Streptococcus ferus TaxID=1345 RepID=UPI0023528958|nr:DUF4176 domain-containing protein [Streptococcus ferus]
MLSIGSIVQLHEGTQKLMILNRAPLLETDKGKIWYDYSACKFPVGLDVNNVFYFNEQNIAKVIFEGYYDESEKQFDELYQQWLMSEGKNLPKGEVTAPLEDIK